MPYALFCNDAKLSNAYPTEADVWKLAQRSGLVIDAASDVDKPTPRRLLDNDYVIRPCRPDRWRIQPGIRPRPSASCNSAPRSCAPEAPPDQEALLDQGGSCPIA